MIKIIWLPGPRRTSCYFEALDGGITRRDSLFEKNYNPRWRADELRLDRDNPYRAMTCCHEMSHAIMGMSWDDSIRIFRSEVLAWRLAKSFCKPDQWCEHEALRCLRAYNREYQLVKNIDKLRIIPINRGIKSQL